MEYIHTRFLVKKYEYEMLSSTIKTVFNQKTNINSDTFQNEYESFSSGNNYMREMYVGDKIVKLCGGTFSNRLLIDEICVIFHFYFDNVAIPKLNKLRLP